MKIITRYVIREHLGPLVFAVSALTTLLLLNQVAKQFGNLVGKGLSWGVIGEFFYLSVPFIVAMTLPMAVLVAVLYAFSRLAAENEITALRASGVSVIRLVRPVIAGGAVLALGMLLFNDQVLSRSNHRLRTLQMDIARKKPTFALREQVINEVIPGKIFLKTGHIDEATNKMREVFIYNFEDPTHRKTIYADSGQMGLTADQSTLQMLLHTGYVLQVPRDDPQTLQRLYFTTDLVRVRGVANQFEKTEKDNYKSEREMTVCEMDAQYQQGVHQLEVARQDLATLLANAARFEATGEEPPARTAAPAPSVTPGRVTSGSLYCQLISKLFGGVQTAAAAEAPPSAPAPSSSITPAPRQQLIHPPPSKRQRAAAQQTAQQQKKARADSAKARAAQPAGSTKATAGTALVSPTTRYRAAARRVGATAGQIDVIRSRIVDARTSMSTYEVEIQKKFALAAACIVFVIFGAPIALRFPRGGVGLVIGVSMVAFALYYVCLIAGQTLAQKLVLDAFWSMWAANAIFTVIGVVLLIRVQRSGATTRGGDAREVWDAFRARLARQAARLGIARRRRTA